MGNCLFLRARGWGIDRQVRKKLQIPGGMPGGGMVTGRIEPCIIYTIFDSSSSHLHGQKIGLNFFSLYDKLNICFIDLPLSF